MVAGATERELTALVIDDDPGSRRVLKALASEAGVRVVASTSAVIEAVLLLARHQPDLVLIDELTKDLEAAQAVATFRAARPRTFVVGLLAHAGHPPPWANCYLDRNKMKDLPLVLGAARRLLQQEERFLETEARLDASRAVLELIQRDWGSVNVDRTRKLVEHLTGNLDAALTGLEEAHDALRTEASLIQVVRAPVPSSGRPPRPRLREVTTYKENGSITAEVVLENGSRELVGRSETPFKESLYPPVAEAILDAVTEMLSAPIEVRDFDVIQVRDASLAVVLFDRMEDTLVGSAPVRGEVPDAVARASLDGINRFLSKPQKPVEIRL